MELKDVLHFYIGCELYSEGTKSPIGTLYGLTNHGKNIHIKVSGVDYYPQNVGYKPILRPLSDMTEEEAIELVKLSEWSQYGTHPLIREYRTFRNSFGQIVVSWGESHREKNVPVDKTVFRPQEFLYLLKQGFDLFSLIESGQAINKTKLNP